MTAIAYSTDYILTINKNKVRIQIQINWLTVASLAFGNIGFQRIIFEHKKVTIKEQRNTKKTNVPNNRE